ncbi:hypothetical protein ACG3SL_17590 [Sphingomonas sp. CJ20]
MTEYEITLVAGGTGSTDDSQLNGNDDYEGSWYGAGNSGGGGNSNNTSSGGGFWTWFPPTSYLEGYAPGGNGTWGWVQTSVNSSGGGTGGGAPGAPSQSSPPSVTLKDVDCYKEEQGFSSALNTLRAASPTASALIDRVLAGPLPWTVTLVDDGNDGTQIGLTNINWDPFSGLEFKDADGNAVHQSAMVGLAHELGHAEYWNRSNAEQYAHAMDMEAKVAAELNAYFHNSAETARSAHNVGTPYVTASSTTTAAATEGRPVCMP